ncbi:glycosyltransferase [Ktedonosporobacter rubrisoli]|uniref:Glycosyltransferase n=1 Tax=Ktedonosporobacter rubrisoli TaxID=2509675 RepID=A0A4P6K177_KTERU|nr:glycosyltransferase [Ktedonosporobacter rubrisoli]QBD81572.1 glycosyltransferase [Ktedonosporobacter rubrisoli]
MEKLKNYRRDLSRRVIGIVLAAAALYYILWLPGVLNRGVWWLAYPFFMAHSFFVILVYVTVFNNWSRSQIRMSRCTTNMMPYVAVLVPTYNEPVTMVRKTLESVLTQRWPLEKLVIVVGDDGYRREIRHMVEGLQGRYLPACIHYLQPPAKYTSFRKGNAKDGNLNAMLDFVVEAYPDIQFIESRDADDLVSDLHFLQCTVGYLLCHPRTAYVQTIKDALVSRGDPFGNRLTYFYQGMMLSRDAANAAFPCGSGLVWRREHLVAIGGFSTWNVVEDLYSGYVALQRGFRGAYLPIVGALAQVAPEDLPNIYKQFGTWALDTFRLCLWKCPLTIKGLTVRQRLQFMELGLFYLSSIPLLILMLVPIISLTCQVKPFIVDPLNYGLHFWPYALLVEAFALVLGSDVALKETWRAKQMQVCLMFVYIKAFLLALYYGPLKKPQYIVTRKVRRAQLYWREILPHLALFGLLLIAVTYHIVLCSVQHFKRLDPGSLYWAALYIILLTASIRRSWYGVDLKKHFSSVLQKRKPEYRTLGKQWKQSTY